MIDEEKIIKFIKDYVSKAGADGIVLGLSGGIDSAVVAVLAKKALGSNKVHCYYLPYEWKENDFDRNHIEKLCRRFDLTYVEHTIQDTVDTFSVSDILHRLKPVVSKDNQDLSNIVPNSTTTASMGVTRRSYMVSKGVNSGSSSPMNNCMQQKYLNMTVIHPPDKSGGVLTDDDENIKLVLGNIQARVRMLYLYKEANSKNCLVIGTCNKSELMIGYFTKYGDGGVDFEPLGHIYKTDIFKLAKQLDIPNEIVDKPPTAGLWIDQTDEREIGMSYEELDKILNYLDTYDKDKDIEYEASKIGIKTRDLQKVFYMIKKSEHKRKTPPTMED